ncbi:hypothetical protein J1N35_037898 [Gossypium stocksii]|uniref:Reverse transcriptase zinc-binding domain-containing protein n=1 Tax=Gossypium stocksii TaxID=47602 RepID=A0A9D3UMU3_9ROSI|nr:hypothetical protein J1N35_037898 [Gossypium stocksii]
MKNRTLVSKRWWRWIVGSGRDVLCWYDTWCGDYPLKVIVPRLFAATDFKWFKVAENVVQGNFVGVDWDSLFSQPLRTRDENSLRLIESLVEQIMLNPNSNDRIV